MTEKYLVNASATIKTTSSKPFQGVIVAAKKRTSVPAESTFKSIDEVIPLAGINSTDVVDAVVADGGPCDGVITFAGIDRADVVYAVADTVGTDDRTCDDVITFAGIDSTEVVDAVADTI